MFRAIDISSGTSPIVALDPQWAQPIPLAELRRRCHSDQIRCPWCQAPVLIRAGSVLARHFAHKSLANCPYPDEGAEKLLGRQALYEWLASKAGPNQVELEVMPQSLGLPMLLDVCMQHNEKRFGYWFLHRNIRISEDRAMLARVSHEAVQHGLHLHLVFSSKLLKFVEHRADRVRLSTTHRDLMVTSKYGLPTGGGASLHFLNPAERTMTTLRGLRVFEWPQTFEFGKQNVNALDSLQIRPGNGEIVHPGEHDEWNNWRAAEHQRQVQVRAQTQMHRTTQSHVASLEKPAAVPSASETADWLRNRVAICERCGAMTPEDDWIVYDGRNRTCKCRRCMGLPAT